MELKGIIVMRNGGLVEVGVWPSLEIWIDGVFRVFTFVSTSYPQNICKKCKKKIKTKCKCSF